MELLAHPITLYHLLLKIVCLQQIEGLKSSINDTYLKGLHNLFDIFLMKNCILYRWAS